MLLLLMLLFCCCCCCFLTLLFVTRIDPFVTSQLHPKVTNNRTRSDRRHGWFAKHLLRNLGHEHFEIVIDDSIGPFPEILPTHAFHWPRLTFFRRSLGGGPTTPNPPNLAQGHMPTIAEPLFSAFQSTVQSQMVFTHIPPS